MKTKNVRSARQTQGPTSAGESCRGFGRIVLALQGGGALGAYQLGVYQAMHESGLEPDWVIGTSIGAINASIIAANPPEQRLAQLHAFWDHMEQDQRTLLTAWFAGAAQVEANARTVSQGIPGFFKPNWLTMFGPHVRVGIEHAAYYSTAPLRPTLERLLDFDYLQGGATRLTVGAVNAQDGRMRYFDSANEQLAVDHIMASGALPPAFPAVRIDGEPYWDGGIYSNTPLEVVLDANPRRNATVFSVHLWNPAGSEPQSLWEVLGRHKDIQYASRTNSHLARQQQLHKLRHIIRELSARLPADVAADPAVRELASWGCGTTMHVIRLRAPRLDHDDHTKDIDFSTTGIKTRWQAGYADAMRAIAGRPWAQEVDPSDGVMIHDL